MSSGSAVCIQPVLREYVHYKTPNKAFGLLDFFEAA